ncbi:hypothetical protein NG99_13860 [Erwinia typographi]|uniref:Nucleotidyl transferase AbiEii/AbiGii toxin family protein n=1 Tax=Erwinia typographi TaxID=371042 RepID=A0A0A4A3L4_9GAMM|nr:nucleotidyl transferase AbiEii/AbiGii toxin family protein [Erwinia typographi]KGT92478.1 hypothetical protein NG99_13860 [Erwinia typographi]
MDKQSPYYKQVALLKSVLPTVAKENCFALKGGTAINLFVRDFPRLSVDIDLAYIHLENRALALPHVRAALTRIAAGLERETSVSAVLQTNSPDEMRIVVTSRDAQMMTVLKAEFTQQDFDFLMSFKHGTPDWSLAPESQIQHLPAVKWKLQNIARMAESKRVEALDKLEKVLNDWLV